MPQLSFYLPDNLAKAVHMQADKAGKTVPEFLADLVAAHVHPTWTEAYKTEVLGRWRGEPPERPEPILPEDREAW
ncbi:hypothetical protein [Methylocaldum sp.]|uniref:hypothetical protein n=1 Tax=Methylocaldum sp. TaxID=1969727 RepID=UPI002D31FF9F|nr:hypothetical protein [Methylocaldum sp.]HYE36211.1 hypothetical protein [Methylocaldum sp.]